MELVVDGLEALLAAALLAPPALVVGEAPLEVCQDALELALEEVTPSVLLEEELPSGM